MRHLTRGTLSHPFAEVIGQYQPSAKNHSYLEKSVPNRRALPQPSNLGTAHLLWSSSSNKASEGVHHMPYLAGVVTGVLLTVLIVFLVDNLAVVNAPAGTEPQKIVNWDVAAHKLRSSITTMKEEAREVRQDVHEATR
jgi:hypothetical protein